MNEMIFLFISIYIIEKAYKKDDGNLAIQGIEVLVLSTYTLTSEHITNKFDFDFKKYSLVASYIFAIYFILKSIVVYTKGRKEVAQNLSDIREIHIINGYAKDPKTFKNNSRVKDIEIVSTEELFNKKQDISKYSDIYKDDEFNSISGKRKYNFTLKDTMEPQILKFDSPKDLYKMKIIIKSVYPGAKYKDTAISEINFR